MLWRGIFGSSTCLGRDGLGFSLVNFRSHKHSFGNLLLYIIIGASAFTQIFISKLNFLGFPR